jgi:hypothetical protein
MFASVPATVSTTNTLLCRSDGRTRGVDARVSMTQNVASSAIPVQHSRHGYEACPEIRPAPLGVPADPVRGRDLGDRPVRVPVNPSSAHPGNGLARSGRPRCDQVVGVLGGPGSGGMARRPGWLRRWLRCANDRSCSPMVVVDLGCCAVESVILTRNLTSRLKGGADTICW